MRGISGSGKSTRAREIYHQAICDGQQAVICSADDYFITPEQGYRFDPSRIKSAHQACWERFIGAIKANMAVIIVDNTNTQEWEYRTYANAGRQYGYDVDFQELTPPVILESYLQLCAARNAHGVDIEGIRKQARRWEPRSNLPLT